MSNPSDWRHDIDDEHEYDEEQEQEYFADGQDADERDDAADDDAEDDDGDDLSDVPELCSCLGALVAAVAFWLGLALTALCFCAAFAVALRCI